MYSAPSLFVFFHFDNSITNKMNSAVRQAISKALIAYNQKYDNPSNQYKIGKTNEM